MRLAHAKQKPVRRSHPFQSSAEAGASPGVVAVGSLIARVLAGSWRESLAALNVSETELAHVTRLLYASGSAALGWWRIRNSDLAQSTPGLLLRDAYRRSRLNASIHEQEIKHVLALLRAV